MGQSHFATPALLEGLTALQKLLAGLVSLESNVLPLPLNSRLATPLVPVLIQYTLANPNRGVPIQKIYVLITEFVRISEVD